MNRAELVVVGQAGNCRSPSRLPVAQVGKRVGADSALSMVSCASNDSKLTFPYKRVMTMCT